MRMTYTKLAEKCDGVVRCNNVVEVRGWDKLEHVSGSIGGCGEVCQWYIVGDPHVLIYNTDELVLYDSELDVYIWGVCFCGCSWDDNYTEVKC